MCTWVDELGVLGGDVGLARHGAGFLVDGGRERVGGIAVGDAVRGGFGEGICIAFGAAVHVAFRVAICVRHLCRHVCGSGSGGH